MKGIGLLSVLLIMTSYFSKAIAQDGKIHFDRKSSEPFSKDGKSFTFKEGLSIFTNEEAIKSLKKAKNKSSGSMILGGTGGAFVGYTIADVLLSNKKNFTNDQWSRKKSLRGIFLGTGAALIGLAIPISISAVRDVEKAVETENSVNKFTLQRKSTLKLEITTNAMGLAYTF